MQQTPAYDIAIIGGGASGLAAAVTAARLGARTVVLERDVEPGLSILKTGNGRCNLGNTRLGLEHYHNRSFVSSVFGANPEHDIERFFDSLGLLRCSVEDRIYPASKKADSVRDVLLDACRRLSVKIICCTQITRAQQNSAGGWTLAYRAPARPLRGRANDDGKTAIRTMRKALRSAAMCEKGLAAHKVILATGGQSDDGAGLFGISTVGLRPVLCPVACKPAIGPLPLKELDGLRVDCTLSLKRGGSVIWSEAGEILFRPYGVSGIAVFNASRRIRRGDTLSLDCMPQLSPAHLISYLYSRESLFGAYTPDDPDWFDGLVAPQLGRYLACSIPAGKKALSTICTSLKSFDLLVEGIADEHVAQVHRGGIDARNLESGSLACGTPGVYACGEALDVDADCGGYNLAWAWLSGIHAAREAAAALAYS